jgi:hypothetical protein
MTGQQALDCHAQGQQLQTEGQHEQAIPQFERAAAYFADADGP